MGDYFVEIVTFVMMVIVVMTKAGTSRHLILLQQKKVELDNLCSRHEARYKAFVKEREQVEAELKAVQRDLEGQQGGLEKLQGQLAEQMVRNQELEEKAGN